MVTKYRLETFTDGVIAIIITIMVLAIPLPGSFLIKDLLTFFTSLIIYLLSFLVVGAFWNQHHRMFNYLEKINNKIVVANIFFLFFLSLIPLFTKWVIENQWSLIPVIGYDIIYLAVSFFYVLTFRMIMEESDHEEIQQLRETIKSKQAAKPRSSWLSVIVLLVIVSSVVVVSLYLPKVSTFILMGIPIASSIFNLFISERRRGENRLRKSKKTTV